MCFLRYVPFEITKVPRLQKNTWYLGRIHKSVTLDSLKSVVLSPSCAVESSGDL